MPSKQALRQQVWGQLQQEGADRFPGAEGRIPNFVGAEAAAARLAQLECWQKAEVIKANPDSPQIPARRLALQEGKKVYMAVPRLRAMKCFIELDPARIEAGELNRAGTIKGADEHGRPIGLEEMPAIDLILTGVVAVNRRGHRIGKGGGYSDLEFGLAREVGLVGDSTPIVTTAHALQVLDEPLPVEKHDISVDWILTPEERIDCQRQGDQPPGILWELLGTAKIESIPVLAERHNS